MNKRMLAIAAVFALAGCSTAMISPIRNEVIAQDAEAARMMKQAQRAPGSMPAQPKASLSSPAAVCPASDSSTNRAPGTLDKKSATPSALTTSESLPRMSRIGICRPIAAASSFSVRSAGSSPQLRRRSEPPLR